ncbi:MAG TPA: HAD family phosphatase [Candidatus Dormibacteraeota bacterium]
MPDIAAAIFDFGGVLTEPIFRRTHGDERAERLARFFVTDAVAVYAEPTGSHHLHLLETGQLSMAEFLRRLLERYVAAGNPRMSIEAARDALFHESALVACAAMVDAVRAVHDAGYPTALLTNNAREWEPTWRALIPVDELFDVVVDSSLVGLRKPDVEIFTLTCARLGVDARQCLFVDDLRCNIDAAESLGMEVLHCTDPVQAAAVVLERLLPQGQREAGRAS